MKHRLFRLFKQVLKIFGINNQTSSWGNIFNSFTWLFFDKIFSVGISLTMTIFLVRHLGPADFGVISFGLGISVMLSAVCKLGLDNIVVRELIADKNERKVLGTAFILQFLVSLACFGILTFIFWLNQFSKDEIVTLIICLSLLLQPFNVIDFFYQSKVQSKYVAISRSSAVIIASLLKLACIVFDLSIFSVAFAYFSQYFFLYLFLNFFYSNKLNNALKWKAEYKTGVRLLKSSWFLLLSAISVTLYLKIDVIMIKFFLGNSEVGKYSAAAQLSEGWYFIPQIIVITIFPSIIKTRTFSLDLYYERLQKIMYLMVCLSLSLAIFVFFASDFLISFLYGSTFKEASDVLVIHIWSGLFVFIGFVSGRWLIIEKMEFQAFRRSLSGAIVNIIFNFILIPTMGIKGAAISTLLAFSSSMYLSFYFDKRTRKIFYMKTRALLLLPIFQKFLNR